MVMRTSRVGSGGRVVLPEPVRCALGLEIGDQVTFTVQAGRIWLSRAVEEHKDPVIEAFLALVERDAAAGAVVDMPRDLEARMRDAAWGADMDLPLDGSLKL